MGQQVKIVLAGPARDEEQLAVGWQVLGQVGKTRELARAAAAGIDCAVSIMRDAA